MNISSGLRGGVVSAVLLAGLTATGLGQPQTSVPREDISTLWVEPRDLETRDLYHGPGGRDLVPRETTYEFIARDTSGMSPGFDVRDGQGRTWSAKLGVEAQSEIVASRILWAIGYHQPTMHYVPSWTLTGKESGPQPAARFRLDRSSEKVVDDWSFRVNPFLGAREYHGLIVANLILNNWDWKDSNNKIYEVTDAGGATRRQYVVRDLGAALGRTTQPAVLSALGTMGMQGTKNDIDGFEAQAFVELDEDGTLDFDYNGRYDEIVARVGKPDVRWTCELLSRLSDQQLSDAFRAAGYTPEITARYVKKLRAKIAEGLRVSQKITMKMKIMKEREGKP